MEGNNTNILPSIGNRRAEFGPGFYTTTSWRQAADWADRQIAKFRSRRNSSKTARAVVLEMTVAFEDLSKLEQLVFLMNATTTKPLSPTADLAVYVMEENPLEKCFTTWCMGQFLCIQAPKPSKIPVNYLFTR